MTVDWVVLAEWGRDIAMGAVFILIWFVGRERKAIDTEFGEIKDMLAKINMEELRKVFCSNERMSDLLNASHGQHDLIWTEIRRIQAQVEKEK